MVRVYGKSVCKVLRRMEGLSSECIVYRAISLVRRDVGSEAGAEGGEGRGDEGGEGTGAGGGVPGPREGEGRGGVGIWRTWMTRS